MRVMVMIKSDKDSEAGKMPDEKLFADMTKFNEELVKAGVMLAGEGLHPSSKGKRVVYNRGKTTIIDGPFAEAKELIAGFWIWRVKSMDEALAWVARMPCPPEEYGEIEIRQIFDYDDLGEGFTPELQKKNEKLRETIEAQEKKKS